LLTASVKWRQKKEEGKYQGVLFFDLSAAYDMLNKDLFIKKAQIYGITGSAINWLKSYLTGRSQAVSIGNEQSSILPLTDGTPQGSACSCTLFALFVGDLGLWTGESVPTMYADDTCLTVIANSLNEITEKLQIEGERMLRYFTGNKMVANPEKTGLLILRPTLPKVQNEKVCISLAGKQIEESKDQKALGVHVQSDFKFTKHILKVKADLQYALSVLRRLQKSLGKKEMSQIANGIFTSHLRYCLPVYASSHLRTGESDMYSTLLHELQVCQNDMLRILTGNKRSEKIRVKDMLRETKTLSVNQLLGYCMLIETWKARNLKIPGLSSLLDRKRVDNRTLRSDSLSLVSPTVTEPFSVGTAKLWNLSSQRFKTTNLLTIAKIEARKTAEQLPL